jgi:peptide/nickel transport system ATP-binding protein
MTALRSGRRTTGDALLAVRDLEVEFRTSGGPVRAVNGISFDISAGEMVGLVGESGSGKSVTSRAVMGLLPPRTSTIRGSIRLSGDELVGLREQTYRKIRGERVAMVFQDPLTALNPLYRAGEQVAEALRFHFGLSQKEALSRARDLFADVGLPDPDEVVLKYPHELSGGMRQRVLIAMALGCEPELLIADEPTTALDVTIQAQILELLRDLVRERGMALLLITHDLGVVRELCERAIVLYAGRIAEQASVDRLFDNPLHPYTAGLAASNPQIASRRERLPQIPGGPPNPASIPPGCPFSPRCPAAVARCAVEVPPLLPADDGRLVTGDGRLVTGDGRLATGDGRLVACHRSPELAAGTLSLSWEDPS